MVQKSYKQENIIGFADVDYRERLRPFRVFELLEDMSDVHANILEIGAQSPVMEEAVRGGHPQGGAGVSGMARSARRPRCRGAEGPGRHAPRHRDVYKRQPEGSAPARAMARIMVFTSSYL